MRGRWLKILLFLFTGFVSALNILQASDSLTGCVENDDVSFHVSVVQKLQDADGDVLDAIIVQQRIRNYFQFNAIHQNSGADYLNALIIGSKSLQHPVYHSKPQQKAGYGILYLYYLY
jgi:hypothetical protein